MTETSSENLLFEATDDIFGGKTVKSSSIPDNDHDFAQKLSYSLTVWKANGVRGVWIPVPLKKSSFASIAAEMGFTIHHAKKDSILMNTWLPTDEPNKLPHYAYHNVGVGGLVIDSENRVLVVREKYSYIGPMWKLPGGLVDQGEEIGDAAMREVFEETGIKTQVISILGVKHALKVGFGCADLYFIVRLKPLTEEIIVDYSELADARWMNLDDYIEDPSVTVFNKYIAKLAKGNSNNYESTEIFQESILGWGNVPQTLYTVGAEKYSKL